MIGKEVWTGTDKTNIQEQGIGDRPHLQCSENNTTGPGLIKSAFHPVVGVVRVL